MTRPMSVLERGIFWKCLEEQVIEEFKARAGNE